ncbi:hypothetical protein BT63DRAFT_62763 [Microthyrium microscopicum]|uniref:Uncharacterized protein n=1 Tax=Microthyrium microscopicum TaxID=703497 RepID=A0A6A6TZU7_9PEZI|nr:hypothetical protein BT63DRAFT_62763 [Microthyrium microscopicum]
MQSIFRLSQLPWNPANSHDKSAVAPYNAHAVRDLPTAGNAVKGKRKRAPDSSPRSSPIPAPKKAKAAMEVMGGAVQAAAPAGPEPMMVDSPDSLGNIKSAIMVAPKPVNTFQQPGNAPDKMRKDSRMPSLPTLFSASESHMQVPPVAYQVGSGLGNQASVATPAYSYPPGGPTAHYHQIATPKPQAVLPTAPSYVAGLQADATAGAERTKPSIIAPTRDMLATSQLQPKPSVKPKQASMQAVKPRPDIRANMDHVRAIVETEINQAILFKHNELRLIDQEIAKCQLALEQIRRCQLIPFPALQGQTPEIALQVAQHSAPSIAVANGLTIPPHPAPWGVTDGPYTRHMAPWLVQSPLFDPRIPEAVTPGMSPFPREGRATRGSSGDATPLSAFPSARAARAASGRTRPSVDTQSPLTQRDPLIIKRNQDSQWVKLYCTECKPERSDFANVQGFLNHCRISHKLDYKSHEAAAIACGRVVSASDSFVAPEPVSAREVVSKPSFAAISFDSNKANGVHPFVNGTIKGRENLPALQQIIPRKFSVMDRKSSGLSTPTTPTVMSPSFKSAPETPYLSKLMAQHGFAGNFNNTVRDAKRKEDLSVYDDSDSEVEIQDPKKSKTGKKNGPVARASTAKPKSKPTSGSRHGPKSMHAPALATMHPVLGANLPTLQSPLSATSSALPTPSEAVDVEMGLSPHTTESAPGLVSDRDEDDDEMDEDEMPSQTGRNSDEDVMMVKIEDSDGEVSPNDGSQGYCAPQARSG